MIIKVAARMAFYYKHNHQPIQVSSKGYDLMEFENSSSVLTRYLSRLTSQLDQF